MHALKDRRQVRRRRQEDRPRRSPSVLALSSIDPAAQLLRSRQESWAALTAAPRGESLRCECPGARLQRRCLRPIRLQPATLTDVRYISVTPDFLQKSSNAKTGNRRRVAIRCEGATWQRGGRGKRLRNRLGIASTRLTHGHGPRNPTRGFPSPSARCGNRARGSTGSDNPLLSVFQWEKAGVRYRGLSGAGAGSLTQPSWVGNPIG
jgi:hypothetical protein